MKVILVSVGNFQEYLLDNITNLILHNNTNITLITEIKYFNKLINFPNVELIDCNSLISNDINNYINNSKLDKHFRNGFWYLCSLRFFYIYEYIKKYNLENVVHLENDVLIYENLENIKNCFKKNKVYAPFDCNTRVIPSFIFIPNYICFKPIIDNYNLNLNDMENLAIFDETVIEPLPIFIFNISNEILKLNKNYLDFNCIFDAAAIGQYLGGIDKQNDPKDTIGFVNETCVIKYNKYKFNWLKTNNLWYPYIIIDNKNIKIINLHIHSKELNKFLSNNPIENNLILLNENFS